MIHASSTTDPYATLGVAPSATQAEIKAAYLSAVAGAPPETHTARFQQIQEAYHVLGNPERRRKFDAEEKVPDALRADLLLCAHRYGSDPEAYEWHLRKLINEYAESTKPKVALASFYLDTDHTEKAIPLLRDLAMRDPTNASYAVKLGAALCETGSTDDAIAQLKHAIVLDASHTDAYVLLARSLAKLKRTTEARAVLERGILADGVVDLGDLPLYIELMLLHARFNEWESLNSTVERLVAAIPKGDKEVAAYVASCVTPLAYELLKVGRSDVAGRFAQVLQAVDPADKSTQALVRAVAKAANAESQTPQPGRTAPLDTLVIGTRLHIDSTRIVWGSENLAVKDVAGFTWGISQAFVNGMRTECSYRFGIRARSGQSLTIECHERKFLGRLTEKDAESMAMFRRVLDAILNLIAPTVVHNLVEGLRAGDSHLVGPCTIDKVGVHFTTGALFWKKQRTIPWARLATELESGWVVIGETGGDTRMLRLNQRDEWNAVLLPFLPTVMQ